MAEMTSVERCQTVLDVGIPDRVPVCLLNFWEVGETKADGTPLSYIVRWSPDGEFGLPLRVTGCVDGDRDQSVRVLLEEGRWILGRLRPEEDCPQRGRVLRGLRGDDASRVPAAAAEFVEQIELLATQLEDSLEAGHD